MRVGPALLVTGDLALSSDVSRLAAAAGVSVEVVEDLQAGLRRWSVAPVVLIGLDQAGHAAQAAPPRRREVHLVGGAGGASVPDAAYRAAVELGAASVLELPEAGPWLMELLTDVAEESQAPATSVAVIGTSGGVGASVFAASLAVTSAARGETLLVDLDPLGPGQDALVGFDEVSGITWEELRHSTGRLSSRALHDAVPRCDRLGILGWPRHQCDEPPVGLVREAVSAARRGHRWLILDLPRRLDEQLLSLASGCDQVVLVAGARLGSLAAAARFTRGVRDALPDAALVLRTSRDAPRPEDVARILGQPLWAELPDQRRLEEHLALGLGPVHTKRGPLARAAADVLDRCTGTTRATGATAVTRVAAGQGR